MIFTAQPFDAFLQKKACGSIFFMFLCISLEKIFVFLKAKIGKIE
jgi:hypothetical protein